MKNITSKFALLILSFSIFGAIDAFAQADSCALKLNVAKFEDFDVEVKNASATALNIKTRRVYRSAPKEGMPYFAALPEGDYDITVTKVGFKKSKDSYEVICRDADEGVLSAFIPLQKGSPREIYRVEKFKLGAENINPPGSTEAIPAPEENAPEALPRPPMGVKSISKGVLNASAINLPLPEYPKAAKAVRASGTVSVQVTIDEEGNVISATAVGGHPLLHAAAVKAARQAKFKPTTLSGQPVKVTGIIVYNFVAQ